MGLQRQPLLALQAGNQRRLLRAWLGQQGVVSLSASQLEALLKQLAAQRGPGCQQLTGGRQLRWDRTHLWLEG